MDAGSDKTGKVYWTEVAVAFQRAIRSFDEFVKPVLCQFEIPQIGLTSVLFLIDIGDEPKRIADLVRRQRYAGSNASYALSSLLSAGLVERWCDDEDRRVRIVSLTPRGLALLDEIRKGTEGSEHQISAALQTITAFESRVATNPVT